MPAHQRVMPGRADRHGLRSHPGAQPPGMVGDRCYPAHDRGRGRGVARGPDARGSEGIARFTAVFLHPSGAIAGCGRVQARLHLRTA